MEKMNVCFKSVEDVREFVGLVENKDILGELRVGTYCLDPASFLGIMAINLRTTIRFTIYNAGTDIMNSFKKFAVA